MKKKNNELSKKVDTDSVLSTVSECTASTNNSDIAGASALAELKVDSEWKLYDTGEGNYPSIDLPDTYNELLIEALYTESSSVVRRAVVTLPASMLSSDQTRRYYAGYHYTSSQNFCVGYNVTSDNITVVPTMWV